MILLGDLVIFLKEENNRTKVWKMNFLQILMNFLEILVVNKQKLLKDLIFLFKLMLNSWNRLQELKKKFKLIKKVYFSYLIKLKVFAQCVQEANANLAQPQVNVLLVLVKALWIIDKDLWQYKWFVLNAEDRVL